MKFTFVYPITEEELKEIVQEMPTKSIRLLIQQCIEQEDYLIAAQLQKVIDTRKAQWRSVLQQAGF